MLTKKDFNEFSKLLTNPPRIRRISFKEFRKFYESHSSKKTIILDYLIKYCNLLRAIPTIPNYLIVNGEFTKNDPLTYIIKFILVYDIKNEPNSTVKLNTCLLNGKKFLNFKNVISPQAVITINTKNIDIESEIFKNDKVEILQLGSDQGEPYAKTGLILIDFNEVIL